MQQFDECKLRELAEKFSAWQASVERRKKRGINDFNPLLCVQKAHDEKDMHSGFLYALLNPKGEHCQDELFLELFLESIGLKNFFGSCKNASVSKEKKNIDIHIFNGEKHIIIENKIWSSDQEGQIARYIESVAKDLGADSILESSPESSEIQSAIYDNIAVVYLAPFTRQPEAYSLNDWQIQGEFLQSSKGFKVAYRQISYEAQILHWLKDCKKEIGNIANLKMAIECYEDVVKRITGKKENTMNVADFFMKNENLHAEALKICKAKDSIMEATFGLIAKALREKYEDTYDIEINKNGIYIKHSDFNDYKMRFICCAETDKFCTYLGTYNTKRTSEIFPIVKEITGLKDDDFYHNSLKNNDLFLRIKHQKVDMVFSPQEFLDYFEAHRKWVDEINAKIKADLDKGADSKLAPFAEE